jgi:hypothetical protein
MHKDYIHEIPLFVKIVPVNIEVVNTIITFEDWFAAGKAEVKRHRAAILDKRHLMEFDFIVRFVETMTAIVSKEEDKKSAPEFESPRLRDLLLRLVSDLQSPLDQLKSMQEVGRCHTLQHFSRD